MDLFIADIHIKLGQKNVPRDWSKARYRDFIDQTREVAERCDRCIIGGDTFDRLPTLEEVEIFFDLVSKMPIDTYIFDGNHEATKKGHTFLSALKDVVNMVNPKVHIIDEVCEYEWGTILPYCRLHKKDVLKGLSKNKPLFTHVRGEIPPHVKPEIDLQLFQDFPIVFAGDLHSHSNSQLNIVYPGSPMTTSFHRSLVDTGFLLIDGKSWEWKPYQLPQLLRKTVSTSDDMFPTEYHHTIYEVEGDISELADIKNSDLLDKKVVKRSSEASLLLDDNMTVADELKEYLLFILELQEDKVNELIGLFNDSIKESQVE